MGQLGWAKFAAAGFFGFGRTLGGQTLGTEHRSRTEARARALWIAGGCRPRASGRARKNALEVRAFLNVSEFALPHSSDRRGPAPPDRGTESGNPGTEYRSLG